MNLPLHSTESDFAFRWESRGDTMPVLNRKRIVSDMEIGIRRRCDLGSLQNGNVVPRRHMSPHELHGVEHLVRIFP